ncbi:annexin A6-like [Clupea harengus]|uniref:Annexin A6-like n=1 Tax=Clupea harengus TaxID=7950 RepID=A0A6P8G0S8_CLUHA|nr:annexin A6-like [Clupea harengus]
MQYGYCYIWVCQPPMQHFKAQTRKSRQSDLVMSFFKKIFKKIIHDKSDDDSDGHEKKAPVKPYHGTVTPHPNFNPNADAAALRKAIESRDVDEATLMEVLVRRSNSQRQQIKAVYQLETVEPLEEAIKSALRSDFEDVVMGLLMTPGQYDAYELKHAMKGIGTCETILIEILVSRSNEEIREIKKIFKEAYDENLEDDIKNDCGGDLMTALLALCKADRCEDVEIGDSIAKSDAKALYEAGESKRGTETSIFVDIFTSRSEPQLCKIFQLYGKYGDVSLAEAVDEEHIGDIDDCLMSLVKCAWNKPAYFAEKLHLSMKGFGTNSETLTRIIVSRSEVDLKKILKEYKRMYGRTLQKDILEETKGHFEKVLLGLCGDNILPGQHDMYVKKPVKPYYGTVTPHSNFSAIRDAAAIQKAIEAKGVNEATILDLMVKRSNDQRQKTKAAYQLDTGKPLEEALKSALKSDFEDVVLGLLMSPAQYDAHALKQALKGLGTCEDVLIEILVSRSNHEIKEIKKVFKEAYDEELEEDIKNDTSGDFLTTLLALCQADRSEESLVDDSLADKDAKALYEAGEKQRGTETSIFIDIFTSRSGPQLHKILSLYSKYSEEGLAEAVQDELKGDTEDCFMQLVKCAWNTPAYFAEKLHLAMKGFGTNSETLTRIIVSRSEVDLKKILKEYKRLYGRTLQEDILAETKGDFEKILLELCGDN